MSSAQSLVIVYQFGKVASTSIVEALNASPGIEAHQCHFLGEDALRKSITTATDSNLSAYFRKHLVGQLFANLDLTYRMNRVRDGKDEGALKIISLAREPMDWLRSCVQQDIEGYKDDILALSRTSLNGTQDTSIEDGLTRILQCVADFILAKGGIRPAISQFRLPDKTVFFDDCITGQAEIVRRMLMLTLRPLLWFEDHFETCLGIGLSDLTERDGYWLKSEPRASYLVLRYEDIDVCLLPALSAAGLNEITPLRRANSSRNKPYAHEISAAFQSPAAAQLRAEVLQSEYAAFFAYDDAQSSVAA